MSMKVNTGANKHKFIVKIVGLLDNLESDKYLVVDLSTNDLRTVDHRLVNDRISEKLTDIDLGNDDSNQLDIYSHFNINLYDQISKFLTEMHYRFNIVIIQKYDDSTVHLVGIRSNSDNSKLYKYVCGN